MESITLGQVDPQRTLLPCGMPGLERAPDRSCGPMENRPHTRADFVGRTCDSLLRDCTLWKGPTLEQFMKKLQPVGGMHAGESSWRTVSHGRDPCRNVKIPLPEDEIAGETTCNELSPVPIPCLPVLLAGMIQRIQEESLAQEEGSGEGKVLLRFGFISHFSTLI